MLNNLRNKVNETVEHVRTNKTAYTVAGVATVYLVGDYRGFARAYNLIPAAVEAAEKVGHDKWLEGVLKSGQVAVTFPLDEYNLFLGAAVNAGKITQDVAKQSSELAQALVSKYAGK